MNIPRTLKRFLKESVNKHLYHSYSHGHEVIIKSSRNRPCRELFPSRLGSAAPSFLSVSWSFRAGRIVAGMPATKQNLIISLFSCLTYRVAVSVQRIARVKTRDLFINVRWIVWSLYVVKKWFNCFVYLVCGCCITFVFCVWIVLKSGYKVSDYNSVFIVLFQYIFFF